MPDLTDILEEACLTAGISTAIKAQGSLGGGCIHEVRKVEFEDGSILVAKIAGLESAALLEEEAQALQALARTDTVRVPAVTGIETISTHAVLLLEWIEPGQADDLTWHRFGEQLTTLHRSCSWQAYGFHHDNHLGATPQPNKWDDDWVKFNQQHRLGHQLRLANARQRLEADETHRVDRLIENLSRHIPSRPHPALLHGDLWSGNALVASNRQVVVIDPACSVGDGWADIAMMQLFGGFPESCYDAYRANVEDHDNIDDRIAVYQLYHVLNHVNLFGGSYVASAMRLLGRLGY